MKKSFGQHLLVDKNHQKKIIDSMNLKPDETVLEIGSGTGIMTCLLSEKVKKVFAVEVERNVLKTLKENISANKVENVEIIESDFLKLDIEKLITQSFKIFGNIPYNITSKILLKIFGEIDFPASHLLSFKDVYLMMQLEVAQRLVAKPSTKEYSPLTLLIQYFSEPKILFKVPKGSFNPSPKVDSAFVSFIRKETLPRAKDMKLLKDIIRISFQQRRKNISNSLDKLFNDKQKIKLVLEKIGLKENLRAENLTLEDFIKLADEFYATAFKDNPIPLN